MRLIISCLRQKQTNKLQRCFCHLPYFQMPYSPHAFSFFEQAEYILIDYLLVLLLAEIWRQAEFKYPQNCLKSQQRSDKT